MSLKLVSASSQRITNTAPVISAPPFTVCVRGNAASSGGCAWSLTDTGTINNHFNVFNNGGATWSFGCAAGGSEDLASTASGTLGNVFIIARAISTTSRHISVLYNTGIIQHGASTTSRAPTGIDTMALGSLERSSPARFWNGTLSEFWFTDSDIQADGAQLQDWLIRQLMYGGPFSVPHIAKNIIEYRSLRVHPTSNGDNGSEVYFGKFGRQTWTNTNAATIGAHPALPYWYVKPGQVKKLLVV